MLVVQLTCRSLACWNSQVTGMMEFAEQKDDLCKLRYFFFPALDYIGSCVGHYTDFVAQHVDPP